MIKPMSPEERGRSKEKEALNKAKESDPCDDWEGKIPKKEDKDV